MIRNHSNGLVSAHALQSQTGVMVNKGLLVSRVNVDVEENSSFVVLQLVISITVLFNI